MMRVGGNNAGGSGVDAVIAAGGAGTASYQQLTILRAVVLVAGITALDREKPMMVIEELRSTEWASATFIGQRHEFDLRIEGDAAGVAAALARLTADLADHEIGLAGHIMAEIAVTPGRLRQRDTGTVAQALLIEALVIKD